MTVSNAMRVYKNILYRLRHRYGFNVKLLIKDTDPSFNPETGIESNPSDAEYIIRKVIELPRRETQDFEYDLSYIAAGKNFVYGAFYEKHDRVLVFDKFSLRNSDDNGYYDINQCDQVIMDETSIYEIGDIVRLKDNLGYIVGIIHINEDTSP